MSEIQSLMDQRATVWDKMTALMEVADARGDGFTAEETATYGRMETELDTLDATIEAKERHAKRAARYAEVEKPGAAAAPLDDISADEDAEYSRIFGDFLRRGITGLKAEDRSFMESRFTQINNAQGGGTGAAGGYAVPPGFRDKIVETMKWYGPMLQEAEVITTDSGANYQWPTNDDTANVGAILAENTQVTEQDVTLGTASLDAYTYTSKLVRVSFQLSQDSAFNFEAWLARKLGERLGRILNQHFTTGTGTAQPDGITVTAAAVTGTGSLASTGGFSYDNLVDITEALDPAYGASSDNKFMAHQTARKAIRKLKDSQNRPLWEPSVKAGVPSTLMGYELVLNNDMATVAQNSKSLGFGNIREAYVARIVSGVDLLRLDERYADFLQRGFLAFQRADGTVQDANAFKLFQTTPTA